MDKRLSLSFFVVSLPVSLRPLWLVWWTTLTMRMKRKKMRRKSNLQGSGPVWALKANCPLFGRGRWTRSPSHPPSSGRLIGPWPACATCQSHWGDGQRRAPTSLSPSWSLLLFSPWVEGDGELLFWIGRLISLFHQSFDFYLFLLPTASSRRSQNLLSFSRGETHWLSANSSHNTLMLSQFWPPSEHLSSPHPSILPTD